MKVMKNYDFILGIFLVLCQYCLAQRGYNYIRPGISRGSSPAASGSNAVGLSATPVPIPLRPIVAGLPTGSAATGFPTAPTAFGAPSSANVIPTATGFGGFQGNIGAGLSSTGPSTAIGSNFGVGLPSRSAAAQRSGGGLFGANAARGQSTQFASGTATGTGSGGDLDYDGGGDFSAIPGVPGADYPIYSQVPQTSFDCAEQPLPGYYSDVEAQCQVFHICALNRTYSFLCPNGTVFSQETLVCVWWNQYDCASSPSLYENNAFIYDYGSQGIAASTGSYQETGTQLDIGSATRQQSSFQIARNTGAGRSAGTTQRAGIFGSTVGIRPTVTSGFGGVVTPITPTPPTAFGVGNVASQTSVGLQLRPETEQAFTDTATGIAPTTINSGIIRGRVGAQQGSLQTAQLSSSSTDREYLPPTRRP